MRWIDRGPEPDGVAGYARQFTPDWVAYFRHQAGGRPTDSYWRQFLTLLGQCSAGICWYCERQCEPASSARPLAATVDHFRPRHRFPELAYEWSNWIFSCRRCNVENKQGKWPDAGYVDPCAADEPERPEHYFDYDLDTGYIIPHTGLSGNSRRKALDTIDDLGLNKLDVRFYRLDWTRSFINNLRLFPMTERQAFADLYAGQPIEYAGITAMVISRLQQCGEI